MSAVAKSYCQWCDRSGEHPEKQRKFGMRLTERGFSTFKSSTVVWRGIGLVADFSGGTGGTGAEFGMNEKMKKAKSSIGEIPEFAPVPPVPPVQPNSPPVDSVLASRDVEEF